MVSRFEARRELESSPTRVAGVTRESNGGGHVSTLWDVLVSAVAVLLAVVATVRLAHRLTERSYPTELAPGELREPVRRG